MSKLRSPINYKSLQLELQEALRADELYNLQNDAKLRAVEQNVPTYEDFRQMVNAAHLTPLKWNGSKHKIKKSWNPIACSNNLDTPMLLDASKETQKSETVLELLNKSGNSLENKIPTTSEQFTQFWRTIVGHGAKFPLLKSLRHNFSEIFRTEIPLALLVEMIDTCHHSVTITDNIEPIVDILYALSKCSRFSLAVSFMGADEKNMCTRLFSYLLIAAERQNNIAADAIKALASIYEVVVE